jgi:hypothetical protein
VEGWNAEWTPIGKDRGNTHEKNCPGKVAIKLGVTGVNVVSGAFVFYTWKGRRENVRGDRSSLVFSPPSSLPLFKVFIQARRGRAKVGRSVVSDA